MKKSILIALTLLVILLAPAAHADPGPVTLVLAGSSDNDAFHVSLTADGRYYVILSAAPLEVGGDICTHPTESANEIECKAPAISGFEVNTLAGSDFVIFSSDVPVPVTIRGGPGGDRLEGGAAADKIVGGPGDDTLIGHGGDDWMLGGPGRDRLLGGSGNDHLQGGPEKDKLLGGPGKNSLLQ